MAVTTLGASPSGIGSARPAWAPMPRNTASNSARICSMVTSVPMRRLHARLDAQVEDALDFGVEHFARRAEAGDAVAHHAAEEFMLVEDGDIVALERQLVGRRQAGGTAADDGDLLAGLLRRRVELEVVRDGVLAEIVLDGVDADVVFDLVAVAAGLAGRRADAAHHRREGIGFGQAAPGVFLPRHDRLAVRADGRLLDAAHDVQIAADVLAGRAATLAGRRRLDVGRALVGIAGLEDDFLLALPLGVAVLVATERQLGVGIL